MKLLMKYGGVVALFLVPGHLEQGGSCDCASKQCLEHCFEVPEYRIGNRERKI